MDRKFFDLLEDSPVVAAVKDGEGLSACCSREEIRVVFILYGDILSIPEIVRTVKAAGKLAMVHVDLIAGLSGKEVAVDFIKSNTDADGIISTKPTLVKRARELGLLAVQRIFLLDSMALRNVERHFSPDAADLIEVLPGLMPKIIRKICTSTGKPVIAGGLISDKEDVTGALGAGAMAVSSTNPAVWNM